MKHSYQRDIILEETIKLDHPSVEMIYESVRRRIPNISLGTVYRNLNQLVQHNLLKKIMINNNSHFDKTLYNHFHFYCNDCQKVYDIDLNIDFNKINHDVSECNLELNGVCQKCKGRY